MNYYSGPDGPVSRVGPGLTESAGPLGWKEVDPGAY
jgi:hypothetical protein